MLSINRNEAYVTRTDGQKEILDIRTCREARKGDFDAAVRGEIISKIIGYALLGLSLTTFLVGFGSACAGVNASVPMVFSGLGGGVIGCSILLRNTNVSSIVLGIDLDSRESVLDQIELKPGERARFTTLRGRVIEVVHNAKGRFIASYIKHPAAGQEMVRYRSR